MRKSFRRNSKFGLGLLALIVGISFICMIGDSGFLRPALTEAKITKDTIPPEKIILFNGENAQVKGAIAVQQRHHHRLMRLPEVVGTAVGLTEDNLPAILVLTKKRMDAGVIPENLEGTPVVAKVTGEIFAMQHLPPHRGGKIDPAIGPYQRPVPIGVSTGVYARGLNDCLAGTITCRVKDNSGNVYALSNNHVYALENTAPIGGQNGSLVVQPGLYDTNCVFNSQIVIGQLANFVPINFNPGTTNQVDAAIALSSTAELGTATPSDGYGTPSSTTVPASIFQSVQKYGRTTLLTRGTIFGINATVTVNYGSSGNATFVNQIVVFSFRHFIGAGDSGSLLVTNDSNANPVGLVFAGNSSGTYAIANPINAVLNSFGITIDSSSGGVILE